MVTTATASKGSVSYGPAWSAATVAPLVLACLLLGPGVSFAQSGIAGVVRDTSGGVLPGVTVEAASPALIEKVRTVVTDDQGRFNIVDLRPGTYVVTFTLPGFSTVRRDGIELPSSFTATVNADLGVGILEETVTITGQAPAVDVQTTAQTRVLSKEILSSVPTGGLAQNYSILVPGVGQPDPTRAAGLHNSFVQADLTFHGARESNLTTEGFDHSHRMNDGTQYSINQATVQEMVIATGSAGAEQQTGGLVTTVIPKEGGNQLSGQMYFHYANEGFVANNLTDEAAAFGVSPLSLRKQWDFNPAVGGPIKEDKLWFFASYRNTGAESDAGIHFDTDPLDWVYTPDLSRKTASEKIIDKNYSLRLTWQATPRNKISAYFDHQPKDWLNRLILAGNRSPEASQYAPYTPNYFGTVVWKSPFNNRFLLEAGMAYQNNTLEMRPNTREATFGGPVASDLFLTVARDLDTGITFRGPNQGYGLHGTSKMLRTRATASYVTGTHTMKAGVTLLRGTRYADNRPRHDYMEVRTRTGVPVSMALFAHTGGTNDVAADLGLFAQDQWVMRRLTLSLGLRYDYFNTAVPAQQVRESRFLPELNFDAVGQVYGLHDLNPRLGLSYDLFGTGRTALKATLNRYVGLIGSSGVRNPVSTIATSATRTWTDRNGDFVPDCNFNDPQANNECGRLSDLNFGQQTPTATIYDDAVLRGFGHREFSWETSAAIQHEVVRGLGLSLGYFRRAFGNFLTTDNLLTEASDFDPYCVTFPVDSRIPGGGGSQLCGLYDVSVAKFGQRQSYVTFAKNFGDQSMVYTGLEFSVNARFPNGAQLTGGTDTSRRVDESCFVVDSPQQLLYCDIKPPFLTQIKLMGVYPLPFFGIQASGSWQQLPGPEVSAYFLSYGVIEGGYVATNAEIAPTLGRSLSAGANGTVNLPLLAPNSEYGSRYNKVDLRVSKIFRVGGTRRVTGSLDALNVLNGAGIIAVNTRYGPNFRYPTQIMGGRQLRLSGNFEF